MINTSFPINVTEILTKELVGKPYRYCTSYKDITQPAIILYKKHGATAKQFKDNPKKFSTSRIVQNTIGHHAIFEESIIKKVWVNYDYEDGCHYIMAELENGLTVTLNIK